jgi:hypothetical protein
MNRIRLILACLLVLALAACGGGGSSTTTTTTCTLFGSPGVAYSVPVGIYVGTSFSLTQTVGNYLPAPCSGVFTATNLPAGVIINASTGQISGAIATPGTTVATIVLTARGTSGGALTGVANVRFVVAGPVAWSSKTANHGIPLSSQGVVTIGSNLYAVGSQVVGNNYVPLMYQSIDGGATWTNTGKPPPGFASLLNFRVVSDGTALYLVGGRTSNALVTSSASYTYNHDVLRYSPVSGVWTTAAVNPFAILPATPFGGREEVALSWDGTALYVSGGLRQNLITNAVYRSTDSGLTWTLVNDLSSYSLMGHCMMGDAAGGLYIVGGRGFSPAAGSPVTNFTQVLRSGNGGQSWTVLPASRAVPSLSVLSSCAAVNGRLYALGGYAPLTTNFSGDVLQSLDGGLTWNLDPASTVFGQRAAQGMTVLNGNLIVFGGQNAGGQLTDVLQGTP